MNEVESQIILPLKDHLGASEAQSISCGASLVVRVIGHDGDLVGPHRSLALPSNHMRYLPICAMLSLSDFFILLELCCFPVIVADFLARKRQVSCVHGRERPAAKNAIFSHLMEAVKFLYPIFESLNLLCASRSSDPLMNNLMCFN